MQQSGNFMRNHLLLPLLTFALLVGCLEVSSLDLQIADLIYQAGGAGWTLRGNPLLADILHDDAKALVKMIGIALLGVAVVSQFVDRMRPYRRAIWYIALVMPLSGLLVGIGKDLTHVDCPWSLARYGGEHPYVRLFEAHSGEYKYGKCFPAGHASAGYTFLALYFFFTVLRPRWKYYGLAAGLLLGLVFGLTQQIRGAHFLSHDLWTAAICWFNSLGWYWLLFLRKKTPVREEEREAADDRWQPPEAVASMFTTEK